MKLSCLVFADNHEKLRRIRTIINKYCSPDILISEVMSEKPDYSGIMIPHLIIMSINTPFTETVKKIKVFREFFPEAFLIVFVQYREFNFSNDAMILENVEFLPLPVRADVLQEAITRITDHIRQIRGETLSKGKLISVVNDNIPVIRQHYLSMLLRTENANQQDVKQKFSTLHIDCPGPCYTVIVADMPEERDNTNYEAISFLVLSSLKSMLKSEGYQAYIFFDSEYRINCLIGHEQADQEISLELILNRFCTRTAMYMDANPYIGVGKAVSSTSFIHDSFHQAEIALKFAIGNKANNVIFFRHIENKIEKDYLINQSVERIMSSFSARNRQEVKLLINNFISDPAMSEEDKKVFAIKCYYQLIVTTEQTGIEVYKLPEIHRIGLLLFDATNESLFCQYLDKTVTSLLDDDGKKYTSEINQIVLLTKQYIEEHLEEPKLSLEEVSRYSGFSKSYYCRLFHSVQGDSFSNYVKRRRIERAKHLLEHTGLKVNEIAARSGFSSPKYFSVVFKQITGVSPNEFRENSRFK